MSSTTTTYESKSSNTITETTSIQSFCPSSDIGHYRLQKVLNHLDDMAAFPSPRSPLLNQALQSPLQYLPSTRFPTADERFGLGIDQIHEIMVENEKERETIHNQPYRTTQLILPGAKPRPDLVNNKLTGRPMKPTSYRPLDQKSVVATLDENRALVNRQFNSPKSLYSKQNVAEAVYVQTGVNLKNSANAPIHLKPSALKEFNPELSPTFRALVEDEAGHRPAQLLPAPHIQQQKPPQKYAHNSAPTHYLNSVGQPVSRIAQSGSFRRLMIQVLGE